MKITYYYNNNNNYLLFNNNKLPNENIMKNKIIHLIHKIYW